MARDRRRDRLRSSTASRECCRPPCSISTRPRGASTSWRVSEGWLTRVSWAVVTRMVRCGAGSGWGWDRAGWCHGRRAHPRHPRHARGQGAARHDRAGDRGRPLALLRAGRPDALRCGVRRPAASSCRPSRSSSRSSAPPTRRPRRSAERSRPSSPRSTTSSGWSRWTTRSPTTSSRRGTPVSGARASRRRPCCASSRWTAWRSTCSTRTVGWSGPSHAGTDAPARTSRPT